MTVVFVGILAVWFITMVVMVLWYGILMAVGTMAVILAAILYGVAWVVTSASGIFSERRRERRFG